MLAEIPCRREFGGALEFQAAVMDTVAVLRPVVAAAETLSAPPQWAADGAGGRVFQVSLPVQLAYSANGIELMLRALLVGLKLRKGSISRIACVEARGMASIWAEVQ